jgi:hypothetical protein
MKTLSEQQRVSIVDASTAGILKSMPAAVAEKDQHITDALHALSQIHIVHSANQLNRTKGDPEPVTVNVATRMVFAGGTCLSKAYGLIERMSEDIDIKVVLESPPEGYAFPNTLGERGRLKALYKAVEDALTGLGFQFVVQVDKENPIRRDGSRYYCLLVSYDAHFQDAAGTLRPQLKVELICRPPDDPFGSAKSGVYAGRAERERKPFSVLHELHHGGRNPGGKSTLATASLRMELGWPPERGFRYRAGSSCLRRVAYRNKPPRGDRVCRTSIFLISEQGRA